MIQLKNKQNMNTTQVQIDNMENQAAQLAVIAGLITTLGDGLATVAAAMALQEAQQSQQNSGNNINTHLEVQKMQKRIDALEIELKQMKKILRNNGY